LVRRDKLADYRNSLLQNAAWVASQIKDHAFHSLPVKVL
jgi:hypothetical protein